jgi:hypothetical protein
MSTFCHSKPVFLNSEQASLCVIAPDWRFLCWSSLDSIAKSLCHNDDVDHRISPRRRRSQPIQRLLHQVELFQYMLRQNNYFDKICGALFSIAVRSGKRYPLRAILRWWPMICSRTRDPEFFYI